MQDRYNLFGSLPDTIRDEWIEDIETMGEKMDEKNMMKRMEMMEKRMNMMQMMMGQMMEHESESR